MRTSEHVANCGMNAGRQGEVRPTCEKSNVAKRMSTRSMSLTRLAAPFPELVARGCTTEEHRQWHDAVHVRAAAPLRSSTTRYDPLFSSEMNWLTIRH